MTTILRNGAVIRSVKEAEGEPSLWMSPLFVKSTVAVLPTYVSFPPSRLSVLVYAPPLPCPTTSSFVRLPSLLLFIQSDG